MPIDPSIPLGIRVPQPENPLTTIGQYANISNALSQSKLLDLAAQRQAIGVDTDKQEQSFKGNVRVAQDMASLLTLPDMDADMVTAKIKRGVEAGYVPQQVAQSALAHVAQIGNDPTRLRQFITAGLISSIGGQGQMQEIFGTQGDQQRGGTIASGVKAPARVGGAFIASSESPMTLTPGQKATPTETVNPQGQKGTVPLGTMVDEQGNPRGGATGNGRYPGAQASNNPPGFNPTSLPPTAQGSIEAYQAAQKDIPQAVNRIAGLRTAYDAMKLANTGPGTGTWQQLRSTIQSLPVINGVLKPELGTEDSIANYDIARKYLQDYANRSTIGSTAQGLQAAAHANASTDISQGAAMDVARTNIGLERMAIAQTKAADNPQDYLGHASKFATNYDRRAFAADLYEPAQLKKLVDGMGKEEKAKFFRSLGVAQRMQLLTLPGQ